MIPRPNSVLGPHHHAFAGGKATNQVAYPYYLPNQQGQVHQGLQQYQPHPQVSYTVHGPHPPVHHRPPPRLYTYISRPLLERCCRRALLIGICYVGQKRALKGCKNDVQNMANLLREQFGYTKFLILTDEPLDHVDSGVVIRPPTKREILSGMDWLVANARNEDRMFFHFSGHGGQKVDTSGDESDFQDEYIHPIDWETAGDIVDDEIHKRLVRRVPQGALLTGTMDCCSSGTAWDLPIVHNFDGHGGVKIEGAVGMGDTRAMLRRIFRKCRSRELQLNVGRVVLFAASRDWEKAGDWQNAAVPIGLFTLAFKEVVCERNRHDGTYAGILSGIRKHVLLRSRLQYPQLSSTEGFSIDSQFEM